MVRSGHTFQHLPPTRFVVGPQQKDGLCTGATPKETWPFQAQIDHAPHRTFDRAAPNGKLQSHELGIRQAAFVLEKVVPLRAYRLTVTASTEPLYRRHDLLHLTPQQ